MRFAAAAVLARKSSSSRLITVQSKTEIKNTTTAKMKTLFSGGKATKVGRWTPHTEQGRRKGLGGKVK